MLSPYTFLIGLMWSEGSGIGGDGETLASGGLQHTLLNEYVQFISLKLTTGFSLIYSSSFSINNAYFSEEHCLSEMFFLSRAICTCLTTVGLKCTLCNMLCGPH